MTAKGKNAYAGEIAGYVTMESSVDNNYYTCSGKTYYGVIYKGPLMYVKMRKIW